MEKEPKKIRLARHLGKVSWAFLSFALMTHPAQAVDPDTQVLGHEGGKEALNTALKVAKAKPALSVAAAITCLACVPVAGVVTSPAMCIACGILIAKTFG